MFFINLLVIQMTFQIYTKLFKFKHPIWLKMSYYFMMFQLCDYSKIFCPQYFNIYY